MMQNRCEQADRKLNLASSWWRSLDPGAGSCSKDEDLAHTRAVVHNSPGYPHERSYASDPEWAVPVRKPFAPTPSAGPAGVRILLNCCALGSAMRCSDKDRLCCGSTTTCLRRVSCSLDLKELLLQS